MLQKYSIERHFELELLVVVVGELNEDYFRHNVEILKSRTGLTVVARREKIQLGDSVPSDIRNPLNFFPCEYCYSFFKAKFMASRQTMLSEKVIWQAGH